MTYKSMDTSDLDFSFVDDPILLAVLEEYYRQAQKAATGESYLGVIVGCGSVVEGLLTWALLKKQNDALKSGKAQKDRQNNVMPIQQWGLAHLINVSEQLGTHWHNGEAGIVGSEGFQELYSSTCCSRAPGLITPSR